MTKTSLKDAVSQPSSNTSSVSAPSPSQSHIDKAASKANAAATVRATAEIQTVINVNAAAEDPASNAVKAPVAVDARAATVASAATDDKATVDAGKAPVPVHHYNTRSRSAPTPKIIPSIANFIPVFCKHCKSPGYNFRTHHTCLMKPKDLHRQLHSDDDTLIMDQYESSDAFEPFPITVVYLPASRSERFRFLSSILLTDFRSVFLSSRLRLITLGSFNYTYSNASSSRNYQAPRSWLQYIDDDHFCIDCIMLSNNLASSVAFDRYNTLYIQPAWSDHFLIFSQLRLHPAPDASSASVVGKGLWRAHPLLASIPLFKPLLYKTFAKRLVTLDACLSALQKWEQLKLTTAHVAKSFSHRQAFTLSRAENFLYKRRSGLSQKLLADSSLHPALDPQLKIVQDYGSSPLCNCTTLTPWHHALAFVGGVKVERHGQVLSSALLIPGPPRS
ncbi:unnamed protein product [Mucor circinelloides]